MGNVDEELLLDLRIFDCGIGGVENGISFVGTIGSYGD